MQENVEVMRMVKENIPKAAKKTYWSVDRDRIEIMDTQLSNDEIQIIANLPGVLSISKRKFSSDYFITTE